MVDWVLGHEGLVLALALTSVVTFVLSLLAIPWVLLRIPSRFLVDAPPPRSTVRGVAGWAATIGRNLGGALLVVAGVLMLVLPGQGLLTIFAGAMLMDLPHKQRWLRRLVGLRHVLASINWIRVRAGREPLLPPRD